jgi:hypothetical protein
VLREFEAALSFQKESVGGKKNPRLRKSHPPHEDIKKTPIRNKIMTKIKIVLLLGLVLIIFSVIGYSAYCPSGFGQRSDIDRILCGGSYLSLPVGILLLIIGTAFSFKKPKKKPKS